MSTIRQFSYLVAVADYHNFRRAADAVNVSQPTLSQQLRALESRLGVTLVERNESPVQMTPIGREIVTRARKILLGVKDIEDLARRAKDGVRLIGAGKLNKAVKLHVSGATKGAIASVEAAKGSVTVLDEETVYRGKGEKQDRSGKVSKADKKTAKADAAPAEKAPKAEKPKPAKKAAAPKKAAAKKDDDVSAYLEPTQQFDADADNAVVTKIEKYLGASLKNKDAKYVSCSDETELDTIVKGFMKKKMGIDDKDAAMEKVKAVCVEMKPMRMKNRVTFYYLLAKNEGKLGEF